MRGWPGGGLRPRAHSSLLSCPSRAWGSRGLAGPSQAVSVPGWLEEPRGHRALAPGSAMSEVTGGTPVLCKYRGLPGRRAGWLQPSIILARRGGGQTRHRAPGSKPVCFPFVSPVSGRLRPALSFVLLGPLPWEDGGREAIREAPTAASLLDFKGSPSIVCAGGQWP